MFPFFFFLKFWSKKWYTYTIEPPTLEFSNECYISIKLTTEHIGGSSGVLSGSVIYGVIEFSEHVVSTLCFSSTSSVTGRTFFNSIFSSTSHISFKFVAVIRLSVNRAVCGICLFSSLELFVLNILFDILCMKSLLEFVLLFLFCCTVFSSVSSSLKIITSFDRLLSCILPCLCKFWLSWLEYRMICENKLGKVELFSLDRVSCILASVAEASGVSSMYWNLLHFCFFVGCVPAKFAFDCNSWLLMLLNVSGIIIGCVTCTFFTVAEASVGVSFMHCISLYLCFPVGCVKI